MEKAIDLARKQLQAVVTQVQTFLDIHQVLSAGPFLYTFIQEVRFVEGKKSDGIEMKIFYGY